MTDRTIPLRLADAVARAFPAGGMTVAGLRRERDAGRLAVTRIAGKEFVTLAAIDDMIEACTCRAVPKARTSTSGKGKGRKPSGASETATASSAQAAALAIISAQKSALANTSPRNTTTPAEIVAFRTSQSPTSSRSTHGT